MALLRIITLAACGIILVVLLVASQGCSVYRASTASGHVPVGTVQVGMARAQVEQVLGSPVGMYTDQEAVYEFTDGLHGASKSRILLYLGGDIVTLGLAEIIFWPMELYVLDGQTGRAKVTYEADIVKSIIVTRKDGKPWEW